jgi:hypothetical protein
MEHTRFLPYLHYTTVITVLWLLILAAFVLMLCCYSCRILFLLLHCLQLLIASKKAAAIPAMTSYSSPATTAPYQLTEIITS